MRRRLHLTPYLRYVHDGHSESSDQISGDVLLKVILRYPGYRWYYKQNMNKRVLRVLLWIGHGIFTWTGTCNYTHSSFTADFYKMAYDVEIIYIYISRAAVIHFMFWAGSTFPFPVCTVPSSMVRTSRCNKVDAVRLYASYRFNLLLLKGQRCVI